MSLKKFNTPSKEEWFISSKYLLPLLATFLSEVKGMKPTQIKEHLCDLKNVLDVYNEYLKYLSGEEIVLGDNNDKTEEILSLQTPKQSGFALLDWMKNS